MALAEQIATERAGHSAPRIAPPIPVRSLFRDYQASARALGIKLMPWQRVAARYLTALERKRWRYREVAIVLARQNGKTKLLLPLILMGLKRGERILHTAQNRAIPRETFLELARLLNGHEEVLEIRFANGQELIRFSNGGRYTLVAPRPGIRGHGVDRVLLDEVREQHSFDLLAAIKPTMTASRNPQIVYLSNAGDEDSVVLNDLRRRMASEALAYLEWSASPARSIEDREGWAEANPALGITIMLETLEDNFTSLPPHAFETEHLCRWVISTQPRLVSEAVWERARASLEQAIRPMLGINMDPSGKRASGSIAWQQTDGSIGLRVIADVTGDPIDVDRFGKDLRDLAVRLGVSKTGFDDWTDKELAKYMPNAKAVMGREFANASATFVQTLDAGRLRWDEADAVTQDLAWTARKPHESGAWQAVKANIDRPITASLSAIRAVGLASGPKPSAPMVY